MKKIGSNLLLILSLLIISPIAEARMYDAAVGRFLTEDPIGFEGGDINLYSYVGQNPVNYTDPLGLKIIWGNYVLNNPQVKSNLIKLNQKIINSGKCDGDFVLRVTGGDRYIDSGGPHRSLSNYLIVEGSDPNSPHLYRAWC